MPPRFWPTSARKSRSSRSNSSAVIKRRHSLPPFFCPDSPMNTKRSLETAGGLLSALALFAIMALTFFDVLGRKLADNSIPGSLEVTELLMVVVIFASLPLVSLRGEHVLFDSMDAYLPEGVLRVQKALIHVVLAALLIALAFLMWKTAGEFAASGETTAQLKLSK